MIYGFHLGAALGERIGLTDEEWALIGPLLPAERGRGCRPAQDDRRYFEGTMCTARTGAQRRHSARRIRQMEQRLPQISAMGRNRCVRGDARNAGRTGRAGSKRLADRAAASAPSSMPGAMRKAARSASSPSPQSSYGDPLSTSARLRPGVEFHPEVFGVEMRFLDKSSPIGHFDRPVLEAQQFRLP